MPPELVSPENPKLYDSLTIEFLVPLKLKFEIRDFPLAQRWAAQMAAGLGSAPKWQVKVNEPFRFHLQKEVHFLLLSLGHADSERKLLSHFSGDEQEITPDAVAEIAAFAADRLGKPSDSRYQRELLETLRLKCGRLREAAGKRRRHNFTGIRVSPIDPEGQREGWRFPLHMEDFRHFQTGRLTGGLRLNYTEPNGLSLMDCSEQNFFAYPPSPMRSYDFSFRLDLAQNYPPLEEWDTYRQMQDWARAAEFDLRDARNWSECVYVARLSAEDLARLDQVNAILAHAPPQILSIEFQPTYRAPGRRVPSREIAC